MSNLISRKDFLKAIEQIHSAKSVSGVVYSSILTSSLRTPKILVKEFCYFLMPCHKHGLCIDILVQR